MVAPVTDITSAASLPRVAFALLVMLPSAAIRKSVSATQFVPSKRNELSRAPVGSEISKLPGQTA